MAISRRVVTVLVAWLISFGVGGWLLHQRDVHPQALSTNHQTAFQSLLQPSQAYAQGTCNVSNNLAYPQGDVQEAPYSLIILKRGGSNADIIVDAINAGENVIVRLGAGEKPANAAESMAEAQQYSESIELIRRKTGNKPFLVTATHNEPNCAEHYPGAFETEPEFAKKILENRQPGVTYITGQIDYLCGDFDARGDQSPLAYISTLSAIDGIDGVALPFYTGDAGSSGQMVELLSQAVDKANGKKIYITESGPFKRGSAQASEDEFRDYITGVKQVLPKVEQLLLFNALGLNSDSNFQYTKPFWKKQCREAFHQCQDEETIMAACFGEEDKDDYYLYPVKGLLGETDFNVIRQNLVDQGYESLCTVPKISIKGTDNLDSYLRNLLQTLYTPKENTVGVTTQQQYDYTNSQVPIWRQQGVTLLEDINSLETYWGHRNQNFSDPIFRDIHSAPVYRLLTLEQQCSQQVAILESIEKKCNYLLDPSTCALDIDIEGTELTARELLNLHRSRGLSCKNIPDLPSNDTLKIGLSNTPLFMPNAYRLAFLVIVAEMKEPPSDKSWSFLTVPSNPELEPKYVNQHDVRVIAFKIPDIGTNHDDNDDSTYQSALELTRDALTTLSQQEQRETYIQTFKNFFYRPSFPFIHYDKTGIYDAQGLANLGPEKLIRCEGTEACGHDFIRALVEIVNYRTKDIHNSVRKEGLDDDGNPTEFSQHRLSWCGGDADAYPYEEVTQINSTGGLPDSAGAQHNFDGGQGDTILQLEKEWVSNKLPPEAREGSPEEQAAPPFAFFSDYNLSIEDPERESRIDTYLVYPQGYELIEVEKTLAGLVRQTPDKIQQYFDGQDYQTFFKVTDTGIQFEKGSAEGPIIPGKANTRCYNPCVAQCKGKPPKEEFTCSAACEKECEVIPEATVDAEAQNDHEPRILGGVLGGLMRQIQLSARLYATSTWNCIASIRNTEQFILNGCGGGVAKTEKDNPDDFTTTAEGEYCIQWELANASFDLEQLKNNIRRYLTSLDYQYTQPNGSQYEQERYEELRNRQGEFIDWTGAEIPFDKINQYERFYGGGRALLWTQDSQCSGQPCFEFVIDYCASAGYNPALCVAMNLSESGGSNHIRFGGSYDFGCLAAEPNNIPSGLDCITSKFFDNQRGKDYNAMFDRFAGLGQDSPSYGKIKEYYTQLSGGLGISEGACK